MSRLVFLSIRTLTVLIAASDLCAVGTEDTDLERRFSETVRPFIESFCVDCHGGEKPKAQFNMAGYRTMNSVVKDYGRWELVLEKLLEGEMPPEKAKRHPTSGNRLTVEKWIQAMLQNETRKNAGDPGLAPVRRLSTAEYDYTIRDLTGVDIRPTREFPVDPANEAGFDNSAESLAMSPALLKKYLEAARRVSEFLLLKPDGIEFAPHPVVAETDRDKYCVRRIIEFYEKQPTDYADYFMASWQFRHRTALGKPEWSLDDFASSENLSPNYLAGIWKTLTESEEEIGPVAALQVMWRNLGEPNQVSPRRVRLGCERMRDYVVKLRAALVPEVENLSAPRVHRGSQPLVLWKDRQFAANRLRYSGGAFDIKWEIENSDENRTASESDGVPTSDTSDVNFDRTRRVRLDSRLPIAVKTADRELGIRIKLEAASAEVAKALEIPTGEVARERYESAFHRFCSVFPDAFYVSERARVYLDPEKEKELSGRLLSAGFHSMTGYFRDDGPLCELILNESDRRELDRLWDEFDFISSVPTRMHTSFIWFERSDSRFMMSPEFHFARAEDKEVTSAEKISQLAEVYLAKVRNNGASDIAVRAIENHFERVNANIRRTEEMRRVAEPRHLEALQKFAERASRRPLSARERSELIGFYRSVREDANLDHEAAVRETIVSVLMSPSFCYRVDLADLGEVSVGDGIGVRPLSDYALASRLSYFLWSSMPDEALLNRASAGELHNPDVIVSEAKRMLKDWRVRGLATEFAGNWLDFRRFEEHNAVDRGRFPSFDNELRQSMFEEPIRFFVSLAQSDRPVLDFLYADYTFVNGALSKHYEMPGFDGDSASWKRIHGASRFERGGLLPMAVFLTKNAPGLRTSPVKRGYWVVRRLLGERIPPPPPNVPELPNDEGKTGDLTLREILARHRENESCAGCHERFDSLGLVFEGFGPIGERRSVDLGGRPVDTHASFPDGGSGEGLAGLRAYLRENREAEFLDNLCRKLLAFGLGRNLMLSDELLVSEMKMKLESNDYRFSGLIENIVTSPQFLNKRTREGPAN